LRILASERQPAPAPGEGRAGGGTGGRLEDTGLAAILILALSPTIRWGFLFHSLNGLMKIGQNENCCRACFTPVFYAA
jgi:hypothetical protein